MTRAIPGWVLTLAALGGCSLQPGYVRPAASVPESWPTGAAYADSDHASATDYAWHDVFGDPRLQAVIAQALANNQDVQVALANMAQARAQYGVQRAAQAPQLGGSASATRGDAGNGAASNFKLEGTVASYELDLFGRLSSLSEAARSRYLASQSAARATRLTLVADVADVWLAYGADTSLLAVARRTAEAARDSLRLADARHRGGIAPAGDVHQAEIALHGAEADIASLTTQVAQDQNALRLLVGADVAPANLPLSIEDAGGRISEVPAGLGSDVLLRRPDVIEAEWQLRSANAQIGAARAALFPKISLTSLFGLASNALSALFSGGSFIWQGAANANYPIFSAGAGKAGVRVSEAQRDAALATYRKAVQSAFADVANALARRGTIDAQVAAQSATVRAAQENLRLADLRYQGGVDNYLQDLTARQASYSAERTLVQTRLVAATNRVALYRALGGDRSI
ncbi:MAG: efflux transporter outer membrane subunit [Sphingomonadales bacterium]|nr:efflux transporter outer membrane subunit [Sphingomonadales bacterium]